MLRRTRLLAVLLAELVLQGLLVSYMLGKWGVREATITYPDDYNRVVGTPASLGASLGEFPMVRMLVSESAHYQLGAESDAEWALLTPPNGTFAHAPDGAPYSIAMFHQLRCLDLIRRDFAATRRAGALVRAPHAQGCLNYLRTAALCQGDAHIEGFTEEDNTEETHWYACRDWTAVYDAARRLHA